ncbi:MAG TPA: ComEC/Rec2 family competence protein [Pyrinomonadaceae bacterium]|nr:ComEC/Rec2 family competence protein [Pyrinomonadaceae bacterium]
MFSPHPLAALAASFALGVLLAHFTALPINLALACLAACTLALSYSFIRRLLSLSSLLLIVTFFFAGITLTILEKSSVTKERVERIFDDGLIASGEPVEVTGVMMGATEPAPDGFYLTLRVEKLRYKEDEREASGDVLLFAAVRNAEARAEYEAMELRYGARLRVMTALSRSENYRNPGVSSLTEYLERKGIDATAVIKSPLLVERLDDERVFLPLAWLYEWRQKLLAEMNEKFSPETGGVLKAALLGNRYELSHGAAERFREGGTFHVLVISGLHIGFIGGLILFLMLRMTKRRMLQFAISVLLLWAYTIAVGASVSVVRAALMFTLVALAPVVHRRARSLNALGCAVLVLLVWRPTDLFDPSFQLTFLSVLAIITIAWPLIEKLRETGAWHPTLETPYPPTAPRWLKILAETLFWSEREWKREVARSSYSYKLFKTPLAARLERLHVQRFLRYAFVAIVVSASVQIVLLPLLIIYFHRLSFAALVLNIWVGALMALLGLIALVALLISQLSTGLAAPLFKIAEALSYLMIHSVDPFTSAGVAQVRLPEYTGWPSLVYILYYAPLIIHAITLARWNPVRRTLVKEKFESLLMKPGFAALAFAALFAFVVFHPLSAGLPDGRLRIDFLDVGQGDSALVTMPDGTTLLVDGGGRPQYRQARRGADEDETTEPFERDTQSIGEAVVSEYLWWRGLDHVDYILATHADADHIDGLNAVARNFHVRSGIVGRAPATDPEFAEFAKTARTFNLPIQLVGRGDILHFGEVEAEVLWPPRTENLNAPSRNNDSVVLRLSFGNRVFLLTGDMEKEAEAALVNAQDDLGCDVLKVAHHGSHTSSTDAFVKATRPGLAVISVGLHSIFGHPHKDVVDRWRASGALVLTTGQSGTITVSTNGSDLKVETFVKK